MLFIAVLINSLFHCTSWTSNSFFHHRSYCEIYSLPANPQRKQPNYTNPIEPYRLHLSALLKIILFTPVSAMNGLGRIKNTGLIFH